MSDEELDRRLKKLVKGDLIGQATKDLITLIFLWIWYIWPDLTLRWDGAKWEKEVPVFVRDCAELPGWSHLCRLSGEALRKLPVDCRRCKDNKKDVFAWHPRDLSLAFDLNNKKKMKSRGKGSNRIPTQTWALGLVYLIYLTCLLTEMASYSIMFLSWTQ